VRFGQRGQQLRRADNLATTRYQRQREHLWIAGGSHTTGYRSRAKAAAGRQSTQAGTQSGLVLVVRADSDRMLSAMCERAIRLPSGRRGTNMWSGAFSSFQGIVRHVRDNSTYRDCCRSDVCRKRFTYSRYCIHILTARGGAKDIRNSEFIHFGGRRAHHVRGSP
jgi:hypothetical protein